MNLIIVAGLTEPPTETLPFRHVTAVSRCHYKLDVLVESPQKMKDLYWRFMKRVGMLDYIEDIITPREREEGVRLDYEFNYPRTIVARRITIETRIDLLKHIAILSVIK